MKTEEENSSEMPGTGCQIHGVRSHKTALLMFADFRGSHPPLRLNRRKISHVDKALNF
jgi:hypothetical protein